METASPASAGKLRAFRKALHANAAHLNAGADETIESWLTTRQILARSFGHSRALFLITWLDGHIVGELQLRGSSYRRLSHDMRLALGVLPAYHGKGIGRALLNAGIDWANGQPGIERLSLSVHSDNATARHLYESAGFVVEGRRKGAILTKPGQEPSKRIDEILMALYFN